MANVSSTNPLSTTKPPVRLPDLLAPAGDWECAKAAVENGADAIYFGLEKFNARMRADNFTQADLPKLLDFLHRRGVKGYVTFNTLVFANELADAKEYLRTIIRCGIDAIIVQDVGIARLVRSISPDVPIHASTQMTVTSPAGVKFAEEIGCSLVILARECSLQEIAQMTNAGPGQADSAPNARQSLPLEVFIHGALCVAYSGQCLTSEALGGRSANRGECAQACRMPYQLIADGKEVPLGDRKYLLSPQDLAGLEILREIVKAGVASLKIEGRLKSPEYVANITRIYRQALDQLGAASAPNSSLSPTDTGNSKYEMEMAFSRGLFTGWFRGTNHQALVHAWFGKKRGVFLGNVKGVGHNEVTVRLQAALKPGDGVVFDCGKPEEKEEGGRVYQIVDRPGGSTLRFGRGNVAFARIHVGDRIWKTDDPELNRRLRQTFAGDKPHSQRPITIEAHGSEGEPLTIVLRDDAGHVVQQSSSMPLTKATKQPLTTERLRDQLGRVGGTPFVLGRLENLLEGNVIVPMSELNRLRRDAIAQLEKLRAQPRRWTINESTTPAPAVAPEHARRIEATKPNADSSTLQLTVLVRNLDQLEAALRCETKTIYCDFEDPKKYREAVSHCRASEFWTPASAIFVASPRIFKSGEDWILQQVRSCNADGYLVRNYDHLAFFQGGRRIGDYSLNVANQISAEYFKTRFALERLTASYDLNVMQLDALLRAAPPEWFEVTIHQHMPMFHMEHCLFCAFLSAGTDYRNCGRPCDRVDLKLRDRVDMEHAVKADAGCRNTVFNGRAQTGAESMAHLISLGVRHFRIEFVNESGDEVGRTISQYRRLLQGEITGVQLWRELKVLNQLGVTRGQLDHKGTVSIS